MPSSVRSQHARAIGLLALVEPFLGPIWVWVLMAEHPGNAALAGGGGDVLVAVFANEALSAWRGRTARLAAL